MFFSVRLVEWYKYPVMENQVLVKIHNNNFWALILNISYKILFSLGKKFWWHQTAMRKK